MSDTDLPSSENSPSSLGVPTDAYGITPDAPVPAEQAQVSPTQNPLSSGFDFSLHMPELEVRMVNAATLGDYETWLYAASLVFTSAAGFAVAYMQSFHTVRPGQEASNGLYLVVAIIFFILFLLFYARAIIIRKTLKAATKTYKMRAYEGSDRAS